MEGAKDRQRQLTPIVARHIFLVSFVLCILLFLLAEWLITLLYGSEFREAAVALRILMPGIAMMSMTKVLANDIAGRGKPEINSLAGVITLSINVLLNITLIPHFGLIGVALACTISYMIQSLIIAFYYRKLSDAGWGEILIFNRSDFKLWKGVLRTIRAKKT
jgi:O-antigen/teichoic acid export membrane protein